MKNHKFWEVKNVTEESAEVYIYGEVGGFWGEVQAADLVKEISSLKGRHLSIYVNSPGGDVFDGIAIYEAIKRHTGGSTAYIDGLGASIASVIPLAADKVLIGTSAMMMIHDPWILTAGNAIELRELADRLDQVSHSMVAAYTLKTNKSADEITDAMASETWFTATEAIEFGLADEMTESLQAAACLDEEVAKRFKHAPKDLLSDKQPIIEPDKDEESSLRSGEGTGISGSRGFTTLTSIGPIHLN